MWKPLVVLALVANMALITPSEGSNAGPYSDKSVQGNPHRKCKKPNEIYDLCPNPCLPKECGVETKLCASAPKPGSKDCKPGCRCADGFLKNRAGICIPKDECQYDCGKNETLDSCYSDCPPRYCGVNIAVVLCQAIDKANCEPGCRCSDGYLENAEGDCILEKDCPQCPNPNEVYDVCAAPCPPCQRDVDATLIDCKPGPRLGDPKCKPVAKCNGLNEVYDVCPNPCPPQRCDVDPRVIRCMAPPEPGDSRCEAGCRCLDGYARTDDGTCVPREECPQNSCIGEHEIYSKCPAFTCRPLNCTQVGFPVPCPIPGPDPSRCPGKPACICESGYARNKDGKCIPLKQCSQKCGKNEVYSSCTNSNCGPQKCSQLGYPIACPRTDPDSCKKGCVCKEGFVRNEKRVCIPKEKCPSCGGDPNAESGCGNNCGRLCSNYNSSEPIICADICNLNGCDCKKGYVLDESTGKCILPNQCVSCGGDFNAKPGCDKSCTKRCPGPKPAECTCKGGCECKDGFVYDPKVRKCVRPEQCTPPCGDNEILSNCSNGGCGPWRCTDVGIPTGCVKMDQKNCKVDCVCKTGYVRDDNEVCVPVTDCPECGGDPNAIAGCGINCGRLCSNYKHPEDVACIAVCYENACDCRKGFVYDENIKKCVKPEKCTPTCGLNEVFSECINGGCDAKNCSQIGKPVPCVKPAKCRPGCLCAEGYLRDEKGNCVPKDQCPSLVCKKHEVYSECINGGCQARNCSQLGQPVRCVKLDPDSCIKGCVCEDGYLRAGNGTCVPEDKCDNCNKPHEHYDPCAPSCPPQTCESIGRKYKCPITAAVCKGACRCDKGYYRNKKGECIREKNCLKCKGPHEYWSCGSPCDNVCSTLYKQNQTNCPINNIQCTKMCYCEEGYARNIHNVCISIDECPKPKCGVNERLEDCPPALCTPQKCSELGFPVACPDFPMNGVCPEPPGCVCADNYVRDENGKCIPSKSCPSCGGDPNAVSGCGVNCGRTCTTYNRTDVGCPAICYFNACDCRKGYVYDDNTNRCVKPKHCTKPCGKNEVYTTCANGGCGKWNCSQLGEAILCIDPIKCIGGCICQEGYLRAENGTCVPRNQCPIPQCGKNERFEFCPDSYCEPESCSQLGFPLTCPASDGDSSCLGEPACICDYGFVRNKNRDCIPKEKCPSCGGDPNAVSGCGVNCGRTCTTYNKTDVFCPEICYLNACDCRKGYVYDEKRNICVKPKDCLKSCGKNEVYTTCANGGCGKWNCSQLGEPDLCIDPIKCIGGCICQDGYLRLQNGTCVPRNQCPVPQCGKNERFEFCPDSECQPQSCSQLGFPLMCPASTGDSSCLGEPACICDNGFVRNENGDCIPKENCPSCGGDPNAESGCGINCGRLCSNYNKGPVPCPRICKFNACDCKKDFVLDQNLNKCVRPKHCTPTCGEDEVFSECINGGCQAKNCSQIGKPVPCIKIDEKACKKGCLCKEGYLRDLNGNCVPKEQCEQQCSGQNEVYDPCPPSCPPQTCESIDRIYDCPLMSTDSKDCKPACRCKEGYWRNKIGQCISKENCLKCKGPNEFWSCGGACDNVCKDLNKQNQTNCPIQNIKCNEMCYCEEGYARNASNICIPIAQCPQQCNGQNEVYDPCPPSCPPQTCESIGKIYHCPLMKTDIKDCLPACRCKEGYWRNKIGQCISKENCLKCTGPNEYWSCGGACDNVCKDLHKQSQAKCPIRNIKCNEMCYCEKGYARNATNVCIPISQCPPPKCGENERLEQCPDWSCSPQSCSQVGYPIDCPALQGDISSNATCPGRPGCVCIDNYVRHDCGKCIPIDECPSCGGDPNAVSGCGVNCGRLCSNYKQKNVVCPLICKINGCDCKKGYVFDSNIGKCVLPKDCTKVCGANEVYDTCANGGCQMRNCSQFGGPTLCIDPIKCNGGCVCAKGYLRTEEGACVPEDQCPLKCTKPHEVYDPCPRSCPPQTCDAIGIAYPCPHPPEGKEFCNPACRCEDGYYRNSSNESPVCPKNEVFARCANGGCDRRKCSDLTRPVICIDPIECIGDCVCVKGFLRNQDGICVLEKKCNPQCTQPNQVFNSCPSTCPPQTCESLGKAYACPIVTGQEPTCEPGCVCKQGYYFNSIGECISEEDCLKCTGPHEYYSCRGVCDNICLTLNEENQTNCLTVNVKCTEMCYCEADYARNASNICIPIKDCPPSRCGPNERYEENPCQVCGPLTCSEVGIEQECPPAEDDNCDDSPACVCNYGLVRNDAGDCIPISECSSGTAVNVTDARARLDKGSVYLSATFLQYLASNYPDDNSVASPTSLQVPVAQLALFSKGSVLEQLLKLLNLNNKDEIKACFPELINEFSDQTGVDFNEATKYYANENYPLSEAFKTDSKKYFGAEGENINFGLPEEAAETINEWVYNQTRGKIQKLVNADMFSEDTRLCLLNAIYFMGNWTKPFDPKNTETKDFYKSNGETVPTKIMYQQNTFNYTETDKYQVLEMSYVGYNYSFMAVLPRDKKDLLPTLKTIQEPDHWDGIMKSLKPQKCQVYLPKMLINTQIDLKTLLTKNGADKMFDPRSDGFEGMLEKPEPVYVSDAIQKAFLSLDEKGTEAAAATAIIGAATTSVQIDPPKIYLFEALRPYIYYIIYNGTPVFCGTFVGAPQPGLQD